MYLQSIKSVKHNAAMSVNRSTLKNCRHIGFGVFIVHSSMIAYLYERIPNLLLPAGFIPIIQLSTQTPKARPQHGGPPGWLEKSDPAGVILDVMDCLSRTVPVALTRAAPSCELMEFPAAVI